MRMHYSYTKYKDSPRATLYSKIEGAATTIISIPVFLSLLAVLYGIYQGVFEGVWDANILYFVAGVLIGGAYFILLFKVIEPAIEKIAIEDTLAVRRGIKRPGDWR